MKILITGIAGFIGFHLAKTFCEEGKEVVGIDNINDYYDVNLKYARLRELGFIQDKFDKNITISTKYPNLKFVKIDLLEKDDLQKIFSHENIHIVCNLAAQAGVRYSKEAPSIFINSNVVGFLNLLECCKKFDVKRFLYASSSSVYGDNTDLPFKESIALSPKNLYAKTKKLNEDMADIYSCIGLSCIGLRFFSVYGTWGRPDMVLMNWMNSISSNLPIIIYGDGEMERDFTFVGDVVNCIEKIIDADAFELGKNNVYNVGASNPIKLTELLKKLEYISGRKIECEYKQKDFIEIDSTHSDCTKLYKLIGYKPNTLLDDKLGSILEWYSQFYG